MSSNDKPVEPQKALKSEKKHIGNLKLSESKKALKIHLFESDKYYVIPIMEVPLSTKETGRVYEYVESSPVLVGEVRYPKKTFSEFYQLVIKTNLYYLKKTYVDLLLSGSELVLNIEE